MKTLQALFFGLALAVLLSSCARSYHAIEPSSLHYLHPEQTTEALTLGYRYNILTEKNNKKFSKAEEKKRVRLVAVEITNNSDRSMTLGEDFLLYANGAPVTPMSQTRVYSRLKQSPGFFMFYLLMMQMNITTQTVSSHGTSTRFYPIGLIAGPIVALGNFFKAKSNNKNFQADLKMYDLTNKQIMPGQTVHGLIGLSRFSFAPLQIHLKGEKEKPDEYQDVTDEYYVEPKNGY